MDAGTVPKDGEARQGGTARRINWSTVSASTPNIKWNADNRIMPRLQPGALNPLAFLPELSA